MKTYRQKIGETIYLYYYDNIIRLWTIYPVNELDEQQSIEAEHYHNKEQIIADYPTLKFY